MLEPTDREIKEIYRLIYNKAESKLLLEVVVISMYLPL